MMGADRVPKIDELMAKRGQQLDRLIVLMKSPDGKEALEFLTAKYGGDVVDSDPYQTHIRIGERRVIDYLKALREGA